MTHAETGPGWEMHLGRWQDALAHVESCDAVVTDPPYSERTHNAYDARTSGGHGHAHERAWAERVKAGLLNGRREIDYDALSGDALGELVGHWAPRASGWTCWLTSHDMVPGYQEHLEAAGRYVFHPLPCVISGMTVRLLGDGPSSESVSLVVARPQSRRFIAERCSTTRGFYYGTSERGLIVVGGKPLWLMRAIIRDYTQPGDLVVDPCAGGGTTLLAAVIEGRRAIGAEMDQSTFEKAVERLRKGYTPSLFTQNEEAAQAEQIGVQW